MAPTGQKATQLGPERASCNSPFLSAQQLVVLQGEVATNSRKFHSHCPHLEFPLFWISPRFLSEGNPSVICFKHWISCYIVSKISIWFFKISSYQKYLCFAQQTLKFTDSWKLLLYVCLVSLIITVIHMKGQVSVVILEGTYIYGSS